MELGVLEMNFRRILGHGAMSLFLVSGAWLASFSVETPPAHAIAAIQGERAMPAYWLDRVRDADRLLMFRYLTVRRILQNGHFSAVICTAR